MSKNRFIKTKSNFTLKNKVKNTDFGSIYERDYMTISKDGESNFRFTTNVMPNYQKKHVSFDEGETNASNEYNRMESYDSNINLKPDYNSIKDFAFYGSAVELVKNSIKNIIKSFPAEAIFKKKQVVAANGAKKSTVPMGKLLNPFNIDFFSREIVNEEAENILRYMCRSWENYIIIDESGEKRIIEFSSSSKVKSAVKECESIDDTFDCKIIYDADRKEIHIHREFNKISGKWEETWYGPENIKSIRPCIEAINDSFNSMSEFENTLLDRRTNPVYTSSFMTPKETEMGDELYLKRYTWPTINGYCLDIENVPYEKYVKSLLNLASFFDRRFSDNIWETMVHDSIKNMDYSFSVKENSAEADIDIDSSRIRPMLEAWGYQFDEIKRYIDTIGCSNKVTYCEKNNMPDYLIKNKLELRGWEVKQTNPSLSPDIITDSIFPSESIGRTGNDANSAFFRELMLNTKSIMSKKGTRAAIDEMIRLFGITDDNFVINEYVSIAGPDKSGKYPEYDYVKEFNIPKEKIEADSDLLGLPIKKVEVVSEDGNYSYVIPWFDKNERYNGNLYFQMKGGWDEKTYKMVKNKFTGKMVKLSKFDGLSMYEETSPLIKIANDIDSISFAYRGYVKNNEVMYITNIDGLDSVYKSKDPERKISMDEFSHYFILENRNCGYTLGYDEINESYGWKNVLIEEFTGEELSLNAKRVLYIESLKDISEGNNPHIGMYEYDSGMSFINAFKNIYSNTDLNYLDDADTLKAMEIGYNMKSHKLDNKKVWWFEDTLRKKEEKSDIEVTGVTEGLDQNDGWASNSLTVDDVKKIEPFNPEGGEIYDEASANSIINNKFLDIMFFTPLFDSEKYPSEEFGEKIMKFNDEMIDYINNVVIFYVKQLVPSTSIARFSVVERRTVDYEAYCQSAEIKINDMEKIRRPAIEGVVLKDTDIKTVIPDDIYRDNKEDFAIIHNITDGKIVKERKKN